MAIPYIAMLVLCSTEKKNKVYMYLIISVYIFPFCKVIGNPLLLLVYFLQKQKSNCRQLNPTLP